MKSVVFQELIQKYHENKLSHAYLIETNNYDLAMLDLKELIKNINCETAYQKDCHSCSLCNLININNLPSLKIIEPDGAYIKKDQIENLKKEFATIPLYSKYNVYIIKNAEKLNAMLKFLEEPTPGILGFFLTSNKDIIIDTIKSRCQSLNLYYAALDLPSILNITKENYENYQKTIVNYLDLIKTDKCINHKELILNNYPEKHDIENLFQIILAIYYENFLKIIGKEPKKNIIDIYPLNEDLPTIKKKLDIISKNLINLSYNVNTELLLNKFVIEMRGNYE